MGSTHSDPGHRALLSLVLVGLPELQDRLALRGGRSFYPRIQWRRQAEPLLPGDTDAYLRHRQLELLFKY